MKIAIYRTVLAAALCALGACSGPPSIEGDAAPSDASLADAAPSDAPPNDLGASDLGVPDAGAPDQASPDEGASTDGGADAGALSYCLDRPGELLRPPTDRLPCELLPPSF